MVRWTAGALEVAVIATRDIEMGEEISVSCMHIIPHCQKCIVQLTNLASDIEFGLKREERQALLKNRWGFTCMCALCTSDAEKIKESDKRRELIRQLRDKIRQGLDRDDFPSSLKWYRQMIKLCLKERLFPQLGEQYWVLAKLYSTVGESTNALKYAQLAYKELKRYQKAGEEMDGVIAEIEEAIPLSELQS